MPRLQPLVRHRLAPVLVGIVGGSGSGKTWLADKLEAELAPNVARLSQDDFYVDRSHLSPTRRARINFDHPRAIDWTKFERVLKHLLAARPARVPIYDFRTHCRTGGSKILVPKPIVLIDGLWLLRRPSIRRLLAFSIFLDCPTPLRLRRRLDRDRRCRGRADAFVKQQFWATVEPMHGKFVAPQARWAEKVLPKNYDSCEIERIASNLRRLAALTGLKQADG